MSEQGKKVRLIACSIFRAEIESLISRGLLQGQAAYVDSMYHMRPEVLGQRLNETLNQSRKGAAVREVLVYGECHPGMNRLDDSRVQRTKALNCIELVLGKEIYRGLRREGAFFLMPEWTERWRQVMTDELGLNEKNAKSFFGEMHKKLIYLDTMVNPVPEQALQDIEAFTGLPVQVMPVPLDNLLDAIREAMKEVQP